MRKKIIFMLIAGTILLAFQAHADKKEIKRLLDSVGIKPQGSQRGQMDIVGFATSSKQMDEVLRQSGIIARSREKFLKELAILREETAFIAGVCPHDDYYYASRLYALLLPHIKAKTVIIFGVFHKARVFDFHDRLVFDSFKTWRGAYGPVKVSSIREGITSKLPKEDYVINNDMQSVEHSVEGIVPFLQAFNRNLQIVSILVPYMNWQTLDKLSNDLSSAIASTIKERGWKLGKDISIICSTDAVHYGDAGWGGRNFAPFGTDAKGYEKAVARDMRIAKSDLSGNLSSEKLKEFLYTCVDKKDPTHYLVTWCGRFSVPFGLKVAMQVTEQLDHRILTGTLLDYGTSVSEISLDTSKLDGMGQTAPNNFHHFVGYIAIGYQ